MEKNSNVDGVFWARSKIKIGYEVTFHAYSYLFWMSEERFGRLCDNCPRKLSTLRVGNPKEEYRCEECEGKLVSTIKKRLEGNKNDKSD